MRILTNKQYLLLEPEEMDVDDVEQWKVDDSLKDLLTMKLPRSMVLVDKLLLSVLCWYSK